MATQPIPTQTDLTMQNQTTGQVDFVQFQGNTVSRSAMFDYGLGPDFKVVASLIGGPGGILVAQSQSTGLVDFLSLNANGTLASTAMSTVPVYPIVGEAVDYGQALVSQGPLGLDFLQFNASTGQLTGSDLVPSTANLPTAVGAASYRSFPAPEFFGVGTQDSVVTQLPNGELDIIGFSGGFGTLALAATDLLPQTIGFSTISAVNQQVIGNENIDGTIGGPESLQLFANVGEEPDAMYVNTGRGGDAANEGSVLGTSFLNTWLSGWNIVDGANVNTILNPVPGQL